MTGQNRNSPLTLRLMPPEVQREALLFCSPKDLALYARVDKAAAAFRHENAASFLEFHLKNAKSLDWDKIENNIAALTHLTDTQIQNLGVEDFTRFLNELRGLVNLHEGNVKKARLFRLFFSFCTEVTQLDLGKYPSRTLISSILDAPNIRSRIKVLNLPGAEEKNGPPPPVPGFSYDGPRGLYQKIYEMPSSPGWRRLVGKTTDLSISFPAQCEDPVQLGETCNQAAATIQRVCEGWHWWVGLGGSADLYMKVNRQITQLHQLGASLNTSDGQLQHELSLAKNFEGFGWLSPS